jgi:hypothetical protein
MSGWRWLAERALSLAMYGETAPGSSDTWQKLEADMRAQADADLSTNESALTTIVRVVSETYTDAGVLLWLNAKNRHLPSIPDGNWRCTPAEYIAAGRAAEVLECARRIEGSI